MLPHQGCQEKLVQIKLSKCVIRIVFFYCIFHVLRLVMGYRAIRHKISDLFIARIQKDSCWYDAFIVVNK